MSNKSGWYFIIFFELILKNLFQNRFRIYWIVPLEQVNEKLEVIKLNHQEMLMNLADGTADVNADLLFSNGPTVGSISSPV